MISLEPIDLKRRSFIFGAAATLLLPPVRTFHILDGHHGLILRPHLILPNAKLFDLPDFYSAEIGRKLTDGTYKLRDIPRWVVLDKRWYDDMLAKERRPS